MGADFILALCPYPVMTKERKEELFAIIDSLTESDFSDCSDECTDELKEVLRNIIDHFDKLVGYRTCTTFQLPGSFLYIASGGMSWGDDPTEEYWEFTILGNVDKIIDALEKFAKEDLKDEPV